MKIQAPLQLSSVKRRPPRSRSWITCLALACCTLSPALANEAVSEEREALTPLPSSHPACVPENQAQPKAKGDKSEIDHDMVRIAANHKDSFSAPDITSQERDAAVAQIKELLATVGNEINADFGSRVRNQKIQELQKNLLAHDNHGGLVLGANGQPLTMDAIASCLDDCAFTNAPDIKDPILLASYINKHIVSKTLHSNDDDCKVYVPESFIDQVHHYVNNEQNNSSCVEICRQDMLNKVDGTEIIERLKSLDQISTPSLYVADNQLNNEVIGQHIERTYHDFNTNAKPIESHVKEQIAATPVTQDCHVDVDSGDTTAHNTSYFNYQLDQCWNESMPLYNNDHELYALFHNSCTSTFVEISVIKNAKAKLKDYVLQTYESLATAPSKLPNPDQDDKSFMMKYEILGIPSLNFFTTNGRDVASIVITGDLLVGIDFINDFESLDKELFPQLSAQLAQNSNSEILDVKSTFADKNLTTNTVLDHRHP